MQPYLWVWLLGAPIALALVDLLVTARLGGKHLPRTRFSQAEGQKT